MNRKRKELVKKVRADILQNLIDKEKTLDEITAEELDRWIKRSLHQHWS